MNLWQLLCFSNPRHEADFLAYLMFSPYFSSVEFLFDVCNFAFAFLLCCQGVLKQTYSMQLDITRIIFNVLHMVFPLVCFVVKPRLYAGPNAHQRREHAHIFLHIFWTSFGTCLAPHYMRALPVVDTSSFIKSLSTTGISSPIILNLGMPMRMCRLAAVSLMRFVIQMFLMPIMCTWWQNSPVAQSHIHSLWQSLHAVMTLVKSLFLRPGPHLSPVALQPHKCFTITLYIQLILGLFFPLYGSYIWERRLRLRQSYRSHLIEPHLMKMIFETNNTYVMAIMVPSLVWLALVHWAGLLPGPTEQAL